MERRIIILATSKSEQLWFGYGSEEEAKKEFALEQEGDDELEAVGKIVITKTAKLEWFAQ